MIELQQISLQRGSTELLLETSLRIHPGEKVALIGANGSGKSSLFALLLGELQSDAGSVSIPQQWRVAHMAQEVAALDRAAIEFVLDGDTVLRRIEAELADCDDDLRLAELHAAYEEHDGYTARARAEQLLAGLGFAQSQMGDPVSAFSGGWRIRLNLARTLIQPSDLLLLDEPTNHLDLDASLWLEQWLRNYQGTLVLISHDRDFIDGLCDQVVSIEQQQLRKYRGNYSAFERQRAERLAQQQAAYASQQRDIAHMQSFVDRFRAKATKARQAQSRIKALERMELIAPAHVDSPFHFKFPAPQRSGDPLLTLQQAALGYAGSPLLTDIGLTLHPDSRIGLLGHNGAGKSTLLKTLAGTLPLLSGERVGHEHLRIGYFSQHQLEALDLNASPFLHLQRLSPNAREQEVRDYLGSFDFRGDRALEPVGLRSGGEQARLALAIVTWQKPNLLLLDEPTNHLDLEMCHALTVALQEYAGAVVVVSHDRHLLRSTVDNLLLVHDGCVEPWEGDLDEYARWLLKSARDPSVQPPKAAQHDRRGERQQAAARRAQLAPLRKQLQGIERDLAKAQSALGKIETRLTDAGLYDAEQRDTLQQLLQDQGRARHSVDQLEEQWLTLTGQLEDLQKQA
ncbi:MAG: ATP-binding cassette domain-containing protein [Spongiibacteraceae bacterium]|jgi:ATP-binding cassette subfamily F protein 3|nr:ATP-binding cassette domain-containing protein [Spongiibacteraceae bacterium]